MPIEGISGSFPSRADLQDRHDLYLELKAKFSNNDLTEAIVLGDDGRHYVAYAEKFPYKVGERIDEAGVHGEVIDVLRDNVNVGWALLEGYTGGILVGASILGIPSTYGASLLLLIPAAYLFLKDIHQVPDPRGLDALRADDVVATAHSKGIAPTVRSGFMLGGS